MNNIWSSWIVGSERWKEKLKCDYVRVPSSWWFSRNKLCSNFSIHKKLVFWWRRRRMLSVCLRQCKRQSCRKPHGNRVKLWSGILSRNCGLKKRKCLFRKLWKLQMLLHKTIKQCETRLRRQLSLKMKKRRKLKPFQQCRMEWCPHRNLRIKKFLLSQARFQLRRLSF